MGNSFPYLAETLMKSAGFVNRWLTEAGLCQRSDPEYRAHLDQLERRMIENLPVKEYLPHSATRRREARINGGHTVHQQTRELMGVVETATIFRTISTRCQGARS